MYQAEVKQSEVPIYGSDRVGMYNSDTLLFTSVFAKVNFGKVDFTNGRMGQKGENKHLLTAASKTETVSDEAGNSAAINSARLLAIEASESGWQVELPGGWQAVDFLGEMAGNVAVGETLEGTREVVAVTASEYWGEANVSLLYDNTGQLLNNSEAVQADAKAKSIVVRNPGQSKEYYLFTRNTSGQLLMHTVDMQTKSISARNIALDNGSDSYGNYMSAIEDRVQGKVYLYATRYKEATHETELVAFVIANGQVEQSKTLSFKLKYLKTDFV